MVDGERQYNLKSFLEFTPSALCIYCQQGNQKREENS